jgi:PAS domain S-box-containing protein
VSTEVSPVRGSLEVDEPFRLLVHNVTDYAIYMLDPRGYIASWNAGAERFKGYTEPEIIGKHFSVFYTEEDRSSKLPERVLLEAERNGRFEGEGWRVRKDGTRFWAHVVVDRIQNSTGELLGFAKITRDLTERRLAEQALARSEQQFRLLVQGIKDYAVYMLDTEGKVANWNLGAERIKGYKADEIVGQHFSKIYTEEDAQAGAPQKALQTALREGKFESETMRRRKDATRFWAHVLIDPIYDDYGNHIGFATITRDINDKHKAEEELAQARVRVMQAQKMEAIGQLTGGIAHDFNNLLTAVIGSLSLARKRVPDDPRITRLLDNAIQGAQRGATLTQRMLAFARRQELKVTAVNLQELVQGMSQLLQASIGSTIQVEMRFPLNLPLAKCDANQLELALLNLIVNARDAMPDGGRIIVSGAAEFVQTPDAGELRPGQYVCLSVTDSGIGMDEQTLARAAEPFFTTKGIGRGTGLGLSMVHGIAEQSGGRLLLRSREGIGTTAEIWLPVASIDLVVSSGQVATIDPAAPLAPKTILVVDDDPLVLMNTAAMLDDLGHRVLEASSAAQALRILRRQEAIDLVITDQVMANMTGLELIAAIKQEWPALPVVLATGYAELPPGTDPSLPKLAKPYQQEALAAVLAEQTCRPLRGDTIVRLRPRAKPEPEVAADDARDRAPPRSDRAGN